MYRYLAKDLIDGLVRRKSVILIFGVVPLIIISFIFTQLYFPHAVLSPFVWFYIMVIAIVSFILLSLYHNGLLLSRASFFFYTGAGLAGVGLLFMAYFFFIHGISLALYPEKWAFIENPFQITFSPNAFVKYGHFLAFSFAWTGATLLLFPLTRSEAKESRNEIANQEKPDYISFVRKLGIALSLPFSLILPILLLLNIATLPDIARSSHVYIFSMVAVLLLFFISLFLLLMLQGKEKNFGILIFSLFLLSFLVWAVSDHGTRGEALKEPISGMMTQAEEAQKERGLLQKQEVVEVSAQPGKSGEEIFNERCAACHRFDEDILGPPLKTVLPKYKSNKDALESFIANPYKIDPSYPAMPRLGLTQQEIDRVTNYVLQKMEEQVQ
jgi:cytochrome c